MSAEAKSETIWEKIRRWSTPPRQLSFTPAGKLFALLTLGVGLGAINTGNNLLFLILGMMLSTIIASGVLSEAVLRKVECWRVRPRKLIAGVPCPGTLVVRNPRTYASMSLVLSDRFAEGIRGAARGQKIGNRSVPWYRVFKKQPPVEEVASAYVMRVNAETTHNAPARWSFPARGEWKLREIIVSTRFPFGLFEKSMRIESPTTVTVFPRATGAKDWVDTIRGRFGDVPSHKRGTGDEFFGLRDYRPGEDRRSIHWKVSARRQKFVIRQTEELTRLAVEILLVQEVENPFDPDQAQAFEAGVRRVAGLIEHLTSEGFVIGMQANNHRVPPSGGQSQVDAMMELLAVTELRDVGTQTFEETDPGIGRIAVGLASSLHRVEADVYLAMEKDDD